ncbi:21999_t:CDS:2, partial [Racocetra persica]
IGVQKEIMRKDEEVEPESFKSSYERSLSILKSLYANHCSFHPDGCVLLPDDFHFVLSDTHYRRWALLCASGDDFVETDLPVAEELEEFSKRHAVK